jgi:DNA helicase-2/ATP-dependent DNA helicase PcrA
VEDALRAYGVPYSIVGGIRFYERREVKDILGYLRLLANPADDVSFERILNVPARGIGDRSRERLRAFAASRGVSLLEASRRAGDIDALGRWGASALQGLASLIDRFTERSRSEPPHLLAKALVEDLRLAETFAEREGIKGEVRAENVMEFVSAAADFEARNPEALLPDFLAEVSLLSDIDSWQEGPDAVTLMTLHNSKGLEFRRVFIAGVEEGLLPHLFSTADDEEIEEERRLFYVGLTRARDKVYLSHAITRLRYGEVAPASPSRFLDEIPEHLIEERYAAARKPPRARRGAPESDEDGFPDYENESQESPAYRKGDRVRHEAWGEGRVTAVEGEGANLKLSILFAKGFSKMVLVRFARIERM